MCSAHAFKERFCISEILGLACNEVVVMATTFKSKYFHSRHERGKHENRGREMNSTEGIRCGERAPALSEGEGRCPLHYPSLALPTQGKPGPALEGVPGKWGWAQRSGLRLCLSLELWFEPGVPSSVPF